MAWATTVVSALLTCGATFKAFDDATKAIVISPTPRELCTFAFSIASDVGEANDLDVEILGGNLITTGNALEGTPTDTLLDLDTAVDSQADDYYRGMYLNMLTGGEIKEVLEIANYTNANDRATLVRALAAAPASGETYAIYHMSPIRQFKIKAETVLTEDQPQNSGARVMGYPKLIARARADGATDAHVALMSYTLDSVDAA